LLYFQGLGLVTGITTALFRAPSDAEYLSPEEHLTARLQGDYFVRSEPKRSAKMVVLKADSNRNYYSEDVLLYAARDRNFSPIMMMASADEPVVILFHPKSGLTALINGSWENIILNLIHSTLSVVRSKFDINIGEISAWIWPGLCSNCFHPGKDLFDYLLAENKKIDLRNNLLKRLSEAGIRMENIYSTNLCSGHSQNDQGYFVHSPQRDQALEGPTNLLFVKLNV
jgi:hypothetical protein